MVATLSRSKYSHASIVLIEDGEKHVVEVDDTGTRKMYFEKWLRLCTGNYYAIYRAKDVEIDLVVPHIFDFIEEDPDYDFTFSSDNKYYCTESVAEIYKRAGYDLFEPKTVKEVIPWFWWLFNPINSLVGLLTGKSVSNLPLYFIGNENHGMMSSDKIYKVADVEL